MSMITSELLKKLQAETAEEIENSKARESGEKSPYPIVYLGTNGKLTVRILFNMGLGGIQKKVIRHEVGKEKVACMSVYGEDCPVCSAIRESEELRGKECGAFKKYGYKIRGVCYAQVIDFSEGYFGDKDIKKKDIITMMYPKSVYDKINSMIVDSGDKLSQVVCDNDGIPLVIDRSQKSRNAIPDYAVSLYPFGSVKSFDSSNCTDGKNPDDMFQDMLAELPNLGEQFVPMNPNDDVRRANRAAADVIRQEYILDKTVNPGDTVIPNNKPDTGVEQIATSTSTNSVTEASSDGKPECFGHHDSNDPSMCLVCPYEVECCVN